MRQKRSPDLASGERCSHESDRRKNPRALLNSRGFGFSTAFGCNRFVGVLGAVLRACEWIVTVSAYVSIT